MGKGKINIINQAQLLRDFENKIKTFAENEEDDEEKFKDMCEEYKRELYRATPNINSRTARMATADIIIKKILGEEKHKISYDILRPSKKDKKKQMDDRTEINMNRLQNRTKLNYDVYMNSIDLYKKSDKYSELVLCVSLATGRRFTEIVKTGKFEKISKKEHYVLFSGTLKKRDVVTKPLEIPLVGLTSYELRIIINKIRAMKDFSNKSNKDVVALNIIKKVNRKLKVLFGDNRVTSEIIRGGYAYICYRLYSDQSISEQLYGARILDHAIGDIQTFAVNYNKTYVDMENKY
jgi:hypothetical protein